MILVMEESVIFPVHGTRLPDYPDVDYKIIQVLTAKLSRVSLQRYPDTDCTIFLKNNG
jgi:ribosomal protein S12